MKFSISRFRYRFTPHWMMCVLALLGIAFFIALGVWQLHRAEEKRLILERKFAFEHQAPRVWDGSGIQPKPFEGVQVQGTFMPQVFLLDNQMYAHQVGYHVLSPLDIGTERVIMIDRGWIPVGATRSEIPDIITPTEQLILEGRAYYSLGKPWLLGPGIEIKHAGSAVIEALDLQLMEQFLHKAIYPFIIRLDKKSPAGYVRSWAAVSMPPERHLGYAVQWFAFALVVFIIFIALNIRTYEKTNSN